MAKAYCNPIENTFSACCNCAEQPVDDNRYVVPPEKMKYDDLLCTIFCKGVAVTRYSSYNEFLEEHLEIFGRKPYILEDKEIYDLARNLNYDETSNYAIVIIDDRVFVVKH